MILTLNYVWYQDIGTDLCMISWYWHWPIYDIRPVSSSLFTIYSVSKPDLQKNTNLTRTTYLGFWSSDSIKMILLTWISLLNWDVHLDILMFSQNNAKMTKFTSDKVREVQTRWICRCCSGSCRRCRAPWDNNDEPEKIRKIIKMIKMILWWCWWIWWWRWWWTWRWWWWWKLMSDLSQP